MPAISSHSRPRRLVAALTFAAVPALAALLAPAAPAQPAAAQAGGAGPPNVIVVMTDDQAVSQLSRETMPATINALKRRGNGTEFTQSLVSSPLCCPSRAGYITGQYPHNNNVFDNEPGYAALNAKSSTLYGWMQAAGYRTGHLGRFLLNYDRDAPLGDPYDSAAGYAPPPGIEHWFGYVGGSTAYYGARFSRNGTPVTLGEGPGGYTTRAINREATSFVRAAETDARPFFLTVAQLAPHLTRFERPGRCGNGRSPYPENGKLGQFKSAPLPKPPSFGETKAADKPHWVRNLPGLGAARRAGLKTGWRCSLATLATVDDGLRSLIKQLDRQGELENTAIFFTSDNGYFFGEHRIYLNKVYPYEEAIRVPLLARVPERLLGKRVRREGRPRRSGALVNNLDLTATILDLAGATPCNAGGECRTLDGRSLRPLLAGKRPGWSRGRALLVQLGGIRECGVAPPERGLRNFYDAVRTKRRLYVELDRVNPDTGACDRPEFELYDLRDDPFQLRNRAANPAVRAPDVVQSGLAARLAELRQCAGIPGRDPAGPQPHCE
jgi:arylsulfatase A-like enzyme